MKRRFSALLLAVVMLLSVLPAAAATDEEESDFYPSTGVTSNDGGGDLAPEAGTGSSGNHERVPGEETPSPSVDQSGEEGTQTPEGDGLPTDPGMTPDNMAPEAPGDTGGPTSAEEPEEPGLPEAPADNALLAQTPLVSAPSTAVDGDTRYAYQKIFDTDHTRYDGRIWTDKTVVDEDITYTGNVHRPGQAGTGSVTVRKGEGEQFLVSYSALASTTSVIDQSQAPMDLVLVLDLSPMSNSQAGKCQALLNAVQNAVTAITAANGLNRVAIVAYSSQAEVLLPLDSYVPGSISLQFQDGGGESWDRQGGTVVCIYGGGTSAFTIAPQNDSGVNKYTQQGVYAGLNILRSTTETTVTVGDDDTVIRQPVMILLSEGEPKIASSEITNPAQSQVPAAGMAGFDSALAYYSETSTTSTAVPGSDGGVDILRNFGIPDSKTAELNDDRHAQTFATLLTAAYMKQQVTDHYYGSAAEEEAEREALVYTVGIRTESANSPDLAEIVLDPSTYLSSDASNSLSNHFVEYAMQYIADVSVSLPDAGYNGHTTTFTKRPESIGIDDLRYNDLFFNVTGDGADLNFGDVFADILTDIISNAAQGATQVPDDDTSGHDSGYITYTDPIGDYMKVMDVKALIINDVLYTDRTVSSAPVETGGVTRTTYTFSGTANNPVYGAHQLSDISIYVDRDSAGLETIHVDIPAALIPLRLTNILQNSDGQVISYTSNSVFPFRLVYSVGLQDGVLNDDGSVNISKVSSQYIAENTVDGRVRFYEGQFSGNPESGTVGNLGRTIGDACVTYTPALDNPFYYVEEDTPLYVLQDGIDAGGIGAIDEQVLKPASGEFDPDQTYYFQIQYYEATGSGTVPAAVKVARWVARPGASIRETSIGHDPITGALFLREGEPRLGNLNDFLREKGDDNRTDTAQVYLYLSHVDPNLPGNENSYHSFEVYHGNNGLLSASLPNGTLAVTKEVVNGDSAAQEEFQFQITLDEPSEGDLSSSDSVTWAGNIGTFTLANGETMTFTFGQDHTDGIGWCVQEESPPAEEAQNWDVSVEATGGTVSQDGMSASGKLFPSGSAAVTFTNTYITPTGTLTVRKEVTGDVIEADVSTFAFHLHLVEEATGTPVTGGVMSAGQEVPLDVNGNYTFTLTSEQSRSFTVPAGTAWTVTETTDLSGSWETTANGRDGNVASGSIKQGETEAVLFTNRYTAPGILLVSKIATGGSGREQFAFTLSHDGTQERFTLPSGGTRSFILPAGTVYTVAEIAPGEGWSTTVNGLSGSSFSGTVSAGQTTTAAFENTYSQTGTTDPSPGNGGSGGGGNQTHILRFQSNGGTAFADLERNSPFTVDPYDGHIPVRTGYVFTGWYQDAGLVNRISGEIQVTGIRTIYAGWQAATVPSMLNGQDHYAYVIGYADGSVRPYANITRAQVATIFFRLLDEEARQEYLTTTNSFPDVDESYWANTAISTMARLGVIYGRNSGLFDPNAPITRAEFAAICSRFDAGAVTGQSSLTDISGHWAEAEIERAVALGWVQGFTDGTFRPNQNITRAQAVTMINRVLCRLPEESGDLLDGMNTWTDCHEGDWYYLAMQEATNSHDFRHKAGGIHERWVVLREDPDWKQYEA